MRRVDNIVTYRSGYEHVTDGMRVYQTSIYPPEPIECYFATLGTDGRLFIKERYAYDGPTGIPVWLVKRWMKWLMRPSLIHDVLCQMMRDEVLPIEYHGQANIEFKLACHQDTKFKWLGNSAYYMVEKFGKKAAHPSSKRPLLTAPTKVNESLWVRPVI